MIGLLKMWVKMSQKEVPKLRVGTIAKIDEKGWYKNCHCWRSNYPCKEFKEAGKCVSIRSLEEFNEVNGSYYVVLTAKGTQRRTYKVAPLNTEKSDRVYYFHSFELKEIGE